MGNEKCSRNRFENENNLTHYNFSFNLETVYCSIESAKIIFENSEKLGGACDLEVQWIIGRL